MPQSEEAQWWFHAVYSAIQKIPPSHCTTYGHIALLLGFPKRARQVGVCLKQLPDRDPTAPELHYFHNENVPWQRVLNAKGGISPRGDGGLAVSRQVQRLRAEGVEVNDARGVEENWVDLRRWGWFPSKLPGEESDSDDTGGDRGEVANVENIETPPLTDWETLSMPDTTKNDHYDGGPLMATAIIVITTNTISLYNAIELLLLIATTFKRWGGFYFWSLLVASFGNIPYSLGYIMLYFQLTGSSVGLAINNVGWWMMVTGQSFVLYSRLHLVLSDRRILRAILTMIIVDAIIFHIPTTILNFYSNYGSHPDAAAAGYKVYEKIQMTGFCIQEFIISGLYIWKTVDLLKVLATADARRTMWQLFAINLIIVIMDMGLLAIEYRNLRIYEQVFKGVIYSVKVKLEYAILGKLVQVAKSRGIAQANSFGEPDLQRLGTVDTVNTGDGVLIAIEKKAKLQRQPSWTHMENSENSEDSTTLNTSHDKNRTRSGADLYNEAIRQISES